MEKVILITERQNRLLESASIAGCGVLDKINDNVLSNSPYFPSDAIIKFKQNVIRNRYAQVLGEVLKFDDLSTITDTDKLNTALSQLKEKCRKIEEPLKEQLEGICKDVIANIFTQSTENVNFEPKIVDKVLPINPIRVEPKDGEEIEFADLNEVGTIGEEIEKRRFLNAVIEGGAYELYSGCDEWISKVHRINSELPILYQKIVLLDELRLLSESMEMEPNKEPELTGIAEVTFNGEGNKPDIETQGILFPFLLQQSIKGFLELFASNGLPDDKNMAMNILAQTEYYNGELWYRRFGTPIWQILFNGLEIDTNELPYYIMNLSMEPCKDLEWKMSEILARTKSGSKIAKELADKAKHDTGYGDFEDSIIQRNKEYEESTELSVEDIEKYHF